METTLDPGKTALNTTAPKQLRVIKRGGDVAAFDASKISVAMTKAFIAVEGDNAGASSRVRDFVAEATAQIAEAFQRRLPDGGTLHIEDIQDQVELALMRAGEQKVARAYVLYREEHARARQAAGGDIEKPHPTLNVTLADGSLRPLDLGRVETLVHDACAELDNVDAKKIVDDSLKNLYDGVTLDGVATALMMTARTLVEKEPNYTYVTARLLQDNLRREALSFLGIAEEATYQEMAELYKPAFKAYLAKGIEFEQLDPVLAEFDLERLGDALDHSRDNQFTYLGLQTLYDRYFIHRDDVRFELPQVFFMRVAMGLSLNEDDREARAIEFYELLSSFDYMASTPTLFNAGTVRSQLSSCYLTTVPDELDGIYSAIRDNALLSKWAGGLGNDWTPVRALGSYIKGTNGKSQGVVPFLKVVNDTAVAVNQGGKRKGAVCAYLETWHLDIEEFLELRKNTGDDRRRTHDMNTANWVPDLFMKRVFDDQEWTLFSPSDVPGPARPVRRRLRAALCRVRGDDLYRPAQALQARQGQGSVAQDAVHAVRDRPPVGHLQGPLQPAQPAAARRRGALLQPVHRDHAEHQRRRNRGLQPGLDQPVRSTSSTACSTATSSRRPSAPRCGCSITSSTSTTTRCRRPRTPTSSTARWGWASWASRTRSTSWASPTPPTAR